ncbi:activator of alkane oxidation [Phenylobacterium montanum]|uniref:Activator of alkane oxidation n=1 Tax=Phenylobacterium montanum TaxID=2823693 RepID=A0A975G3B0_9CAUL|nr:activator of alkane oxidation [Caulobacter sp. S6]QUD89783.1 activator of alkane oxidation [Caulobacter sp. S6]
MRVLATIAATALVSFGFAATASAYSFHPRSTSFTGVGSTKLTKGLLSVPCTAHFTGHTDSLGKGYITAASFSGSSACSAIRAAALPWHALATSLHGATVYNAEVTASIFGTCGPSNVPVTVSSTGVITFSNATLKPNCVVSGNVQTTPHVTIVSP